MKNKDKKRELNFFVHAKKVMGADRFFESIQRGKIRVQEILKHSNKTLVLSERDFKKVEDELKKTTKTCPKLDKAFEEHKSKFSADD